MRLQYEALSVRQPLFVGLTYDDEHLPLELDPETVLYENRVYHGALDRSHLDKFLYTVRHPLRKAGHILRYYAIGEYGTQLGRPHYHLQWFSDYPLGYENCMYAQDQDSSYCKHICKTDCVHRHIVNSWPYGHATSYPCTPADIGYITLLHVTGKEPPFPHLPPAFQTQSKHLGEFFFTQKQLVEKIFVEEKCFFTYTPDGIQTALPRYYRDRIFTPKEREDLRLALDEDPSAMAKSHQFTHDWQKNSWRAKGKL